MKFVLLLVLVLAVYARDPSADCKCPNGEYYVIATNECKEATPVVENCKTYSNEATPPTYTMKCSSCEDGYWLNSSKTCEEHGLANCLRAQGSDKTKCSTCEESFYVKDGACVAYPDTLTPDNCKTYRMYGTTPKCSSCNDDYHEIYDSTDYSVKSCLEKTSIANCETVRMKSGSETVQECRSCEKGYYENNGACTEYPTTVEFCTQYSMVGSDVKCTQCDYSEKKALKDDKCEDSGLDIDGCDRYSHDGTRFYCSSCDWEDSKKTYDSNDNIATCTECPWYPSGANTLFVSLALFAILALLF